MSKASAVSLTDSSTSPSGRWLMAKSPRASARYLSIRPGFCLFSAAATDSRQRHLRQPQPGGDRTPVAVQSSIAEGLGPEPRSFVTTRPVGEHLGLVEG